MNPPEIVNIDYFANHKYVVADIIQGGMGMVYKLFPICGDEQTIAMKTIKGNSSIEAFDIECEAWFSVAHHPNVASPLAFGSYRSLPSILIEWYPNSLADLKATEMPGKQIQDLISGTINALSFSYHEKRLIHQDIKPSNILIDESGSTRLSDFGLARCVVRTAKERIVYDLGDIPQSTSRELSGTPFYMAPELWDGITPSVRTDIFSLGVTFYQFLTKEHPFVENTEERRVSDKVRLEPLIFALQSKGDFGLQIRHLITTCLELDPRNRYQTYEEIFQDNAWLTQTSLNNSWSVERSKIVVGSSQFYRSKGDVKSAFSVLEKFLDKKPNDPILMAELGNLNNAIGKHSEAELHFSLAYNNLKKESGVFGTYFVPQPALAWARCLIKLDRPQEALNIIDDVLRWENILPANIKPKQSLADSGLCSEIGWYYLYRGEFEKATNTLLKYSSRRSLDKEETVWLVEAAWISGLIKFSADEITLKIVGTLPDVMASKGEIEYAWSRVILHEHSNPLLKAKLWGTNPSYFFVETNNLEKAEGLKSGSLMIPNEISKQIPFVVIMDKFSTGGKHHELIRSISKI
jgi:serine/threonine protein kinase